MVFPRSKLTTFLKGKQVSVDLAAPCAFLSKHIISMATSNKISEHGPTFRKESSMERLAIPEIRHGHPQPRQGLRASSLRWCRAARASRPRSRSGTWTRSRTWSPSTSTSRRSATAPSGSTAATPRSRT
eukprot:3915739-Prymnesium_polylepis.1